MRESGLLRGYLYFQNALLTLKIFWNKYDVAVAVGMYAMMKSSVGQMDRRLSGGDRICGDYGLSGINWICK